MRTIIIVLSLVALLTTGCDPVDQVRKMREADRQKQKENNERQVKKAFENFNQKPQGTEQEELKPN
jgi:PBP1b-binding outer membrane lipoprotein LpoB